eukprot:Gb_39762 [translate_table: standard]
MANNAILNVNPTRVRYTQQCIANHFKEELSQEENSRRQTQANSDFRAINEYKDEKGVTCSNDNRRFAVSQKENVSEIEANVHSRSVYRGPALPTLNAEMSQPIFAPTIRSGGKGGGSAAKSSTAAKWSKSSICFK